MPQEALSHPNSFGKVCRSKLGTGSTFSRDRNVVYWPGMLEDIKRVTTTCPVCEENMPAQIKQDIRAHTIPEQPWAMVGLDLSCGTKEKIT